MASGSSQAITRSQENEEIKPRKVHIAVAKTLLHSQLQLRRGRLRFSDNRALQVQNEKKDMRKVHIAK